MDDEDIVVMKSIGLIPEINSFCRDECPFKNCLADDEDPLNCWMIQRKFNLRK